MSDTSIERRPELSVSELPQAELLARLDQANAALAEAKTLPEVKAVRDKIAAIEGYLRQRDRSEAIANEATRLKLRAERRLGELLKAKPRAKTGPRPKLGDTRSRNSATAPRLVDLGISTKQASRWQKIAALPADVVEAKIDAATRKGEQISAKEVVRQTTKETRPEPPPPPPLPAEVYDLIYADPPWQTDLERGEGRDVQNHYPTMALAEIKALAVAEFAHRDCVLFLWATSPLLPEALEVMAAWGFTYKSSLIWEKSGIAQGWYARINHEILLIGTRGKPGVPETADRPGSVVSASKGRHSEKPAAFAEIIERMYPNKKRVELFARDGSRPGWSYWGNEIGNARNGGGEDCGDGGGGAPDLGEGQVLGKLEL